ncbi:TPA: hypothetical protein OV554_003707, partial [Acinetobacter baumannii]|nr:hypothetical protein [Acinetobacter baumannii]
MNINKKQSYTPVINLKELSNDKLQVHSHVKELPKEGLITFKINADFKSLSLSFDGLDCFTEEDGEEYILGSVFLEATYQANQPPIKELLTTIKLKVIQNRKLTPTANLKRTRLEVMEAWESALNFAFDSVADSKSSPTSVARELTG